MKFIGKLDNIIYNGRFLARTSQKPKIGCTVLDKHKNRIGRVKQIIGPVENPYLIIIPNKDVKASFKLIGTDLYIE